MPDPLLAWQVALQRDRLAGQIWHSLVVLLYHLLATAAPLSHRLRALQVARLMMMMLIMM